MNYTCNISVVFPSLQFMFIICFLSSHALFFRGCVYITNYNLQFFYDIDFHAAIIQQNPAGAVALSHSLFRAVT